MSYREIIKTKLFPPPLTAQFVLRSRLTDIVVDGRMRKLALVCGPPGFGKTILLAQLREAQHRNGATCCWLSLGEEEQDPRSFFIALIYALEGAFSTGWRKTYIERLSHPMDKLGDVLVGLINDLVQAEQSIVLFLDDYNGVTNREINSLMALLLRRLPENVKVVISSRVQPDLPLVELRAQSEILEIDALDLQFTLDETQDFIKHRYSYALSAEQIALLHQKTEGWVVALQMIGFAMRSLDQVDEVIKAADGSFHYIADFLALNVMEQLPDQIQEFLLNTSILHRLNAELCQVVTGLPGSQQTLERLEADNLFVVSLDQQREWFRYHHMLEDFLRGQLKKRYPERIPQLLKAAHQWCLDNNLLIEAINYCFDGKDYTKAGELLGHHGLEFIGQDIWPVIIEKINKLPEAVVNQQPRLLLLQHMYFFHELRPDESRNKLEQLKVLLATPPPALNQDEVSSLLCVVNVLEAGVAIAAENVDVVKEITKRPLPDELGAFAGFRALMLNLLGYASNARGELEEAEAALHESVVLSESMGNTFGVIVAQSYLGVSHRHRGDLKGALLLFHGVEQKVRENYGDQSPRIKLGQVLAATVYYEQGEIDKAQALLPPMETLASMSPMEVVLSGGLCHVAIHAQRNDEKAAFNALDKLESLCPLAQVERVAISIDYARIKLLLRQGKVDQAETLAAKYEVYIDVPSDAPADKHWDRVLLLRRLIASRILLAKGELGSVISCLEFVLELSCSFNRVHRELEVLVLLSLAHWRNESPEIAADLLSRAIEKGVSMGFLRVFLDEGEVFNELVSGLLDGRAGAGKILPAGIAESIVNMQASTVLVSRPEKPVPPAGKGACEQLTRRELDVIKQVALGNSNKVVAQVLAVSEYTVKEHLKRIYSKLDAKNRTSAVRIAQKSGLIDNVH